MSTLEPLERLEQILWELCPHLRNIRLVIQDLDQPDARATSVTFHRQRVVSLSPEYMPVEVLRVTDLGHLPLAQVAGQAEPNPARVRPSDLAILELVEIEPGLKGLVIARRLGVTPVTARARLGRLVRKLGWLASSHRDGYTLTEAGRAALARAQGR